jgi:hypothetical protein
MTETFANIYKVLCTEVHSFAVLCIFILLGIETDIFEILKLWPLQI